MIDRRIKIRHIQGFVEIARQNSMKRAAERLFLTQPAMSKTLKELEEIVGSSLMVRSRAGIDLTPAGEIFLQFAEMSVAALQQGLSGVDQISQGRAGKLAIGALPSVAAGLLPQAILEFETLSPGVLVSITDGPHGFLIDRLKTGELDLVIGRLGAPELMQGVTFTQLYNERVVFVVRPEHPLLDRPSLEAITGWPVVYPSQGSAIRPLVERCLIAHGMGDFPRRIETVSGAFGRSYLSQTDAVWIISAGVVADDIRRGRLVELPLDLELTKGPVGLMARPDKEITPADRLFRMALNKAVEALEVY